MPHKLDRWVAVAPEFTPSPAGGGGGETTGPSLSAIRKPSSAYQFFQKAQGAAVKQDLVSRTGAFDLATYSRAVRDAWQALSEAERQVYVEQAREDAARYAQESHEADRAALARREQVQRQNQALYLEDDAAEEEEDPGDEDDADDDFGRPRKRTTRKGWERKQKTKAKKQRQADKAQRRQERNLAKADDQDFQEDEEDEEEEGAWNDDDDSDEASHAQKSKKKKNATPRALTQKQQDYRAKVAQQQQEKHEYMAVRHEDLRKEKVAQAKRRLEFLLSQSNIFSHFGRVREESAKYGLSLTNTTTGSKTSQTSNDATGTMGADVEAPTEASTSLTEKADQNASRRRRDGASGAPGLDDEQEGRRTSSGKANDDVAELEEADEHQATYLSQQPSTLGHGTMRQYQLEGLNWMIRLQENGVNGILADEMGLGKTLQAISILVYMLEYRDVSGPHLIVVPKSTLSNWMNEVERWAPTLTAIKFHGDKATREDIVNTILVPAQRDEDRDWNVVITTYEVCNIEKNILKKFPWSYLIIDEAHRLKNEASSFSKTVRQFETRYRILLTGTPLQNSLHELWALLNFLVPDVFESAEQFDEWFNLDIEDNAEKNKLISQLHKILRPFMLRRLKADVETSLPPKHETILFTGMSAMQKKLYRDILIRDLDAIQGSSGSRTAILNIVMQLRKCAGHPYLFPGVEDRSLPPLGDHLVENCGKMVVLDKLLRRLRERNHRVLLFSQMTKLLDIMEDYFIMRHYPYCRIDGNTSYEEREAHIDAFNAPNSEKFVFLLSTRAGGLGINLQTADVVILYDSDWNPQQDLQAQDRAHRIGQKKAVQVFRLVTEHTIEEKIVERAQQKLKLDAMVVQQGRLKDKDNKLSRDELLAAVRFGADKIFKSKDSSITDDDIDMILDAGKRKTQELNEKLRAADKGDLLDFKLDGSSSFQTFEGVDYSSHVFAQAKAEAEMLGIFDIGKRERKSANYNENSLFQQQISALQGGVKKPKKRREVKLPKHLRLPRFEEWQMYDREALIQIQEEEEAAFKSLPEEQQKLASFHRDPEGGNDQGLDDGMVPESVEVPPLLDAEKQARKEKLLSEGFSQWSRLDYHAFLKGSARYGRKEFEKIALEVGKPESAVAEFANAFWGEIGRTRISEHEYDRAVKLIERGEKKIGEIKGLERGARILVSLFDNPWEELEFTHVNCKDKMFTAEEDRHLLCWTRKYGYGQWQAIKLAVRRNPNFRFDYFLRSLPVDLLGRRCEQLMKAAEKEVEALEKKVREELGLPVEKGEDGKELPPVKLPKIRYLQRQRLEAKSKKAEQERSQLQGKVSELEEQIREIQNRLKVISQGGQISEREAEREKRVHRSSIESEDAGATMDADNETTERDDGAPGPDGKFVPFPAYDGSEPPEDWKKPFTHFCNQTRKSVKASLIAGERKDKKKVNDLLREKWLDLDEREKVVWRKWTDWDKLRHKRDVSIFESRRGGVDDGDEQAEDDMQAMHVPKKRRPSEHDEIPRKKNKG